MKNKLLTFLSLALLSTLGSQFSTAFAQGSLTPPGAPAPTMKTLAQIEPRTPISSAPFIISAAGSYYLTTNLTVSAGNAITIGTNNVTLDLNGFTISSTESAPTGMGIQLGTGSGVKNIAILNGVIAGGVTNDSVGLFGGSGFGYGITLSGASVNVRVTGVSVSGCLYDGINLSSQNSTVVNSCTVNSVGGAGIRAQSVSDSTALNCGGYGIFASTAANCYGQSLGSSAGLNAETADNCRGSSSNGIGLSAGNANNCSGSSSNGNGLDASTANNCSGYSSSDRGLHVVAANNCYGYSSNYFGLYAHTASNCRGDSSSYYGVYASRLAVGCFGTSSTGTGLWAFNANNCYGETGSPSPSQFGLYAYDIAVGSYGSSSVGGVGIRGYILNSCDGSSIQYTYKYNMP